MLPSWKGRPWTKEDVCSTVFQPPAPSTVPKSQIYPWTLETELHLEQPQLLHNDPQNITTAHIYSSNQDKLKDLLKNPQGFKCSFWTRGETSLCSCPAVSALWRFNVTWVTWKGWNCWFAVSHPTVMSKMLLPTELDTAMSPMPLRATITLVMRSGMDVPAAKIVRPMISSEMPMVSPTYGEGGGWGGGQRSEWKELQLTIELVTTSLWCFPTLRTRAKRWPIFEQHCNFSILKLYVWKYFFMIHGFNRENGSSVFNTCPVWFTMTLIASPLLSFV